MTKRSRADALAPTRAGTNIVRLGTKDPSGRGPAVGTSGTGSKTGVNATGDKGTVMVETEANNMEQGTGRKRVIQERGGNMGGAC